MTNPETGFELATKATIQNNIREAYAAGDSNQVNAHLDIFPYGRERPNAPHDQFVTGLRNPKVARFFKPVVDEGLREAA